MPAIMPSSGSIDYMLSHVNINKQMSNLDERIRNHVDQKQQRVVQAIQQTDIAFKEAAIKARQTYVGSVIDTYA